MSRVREGQFVMLVRRNGGTTMLRMSTPLTERLEVQMFRSETQDARTAVFTRRGPEGGPWIIYEESSVVPTP